MKKTRFFAICEFLRHEITGSYKHHLLPAQTKSLCLPDGDFVPQKTRISRISAIVDTLTGGKSADSAFGIEWDPSVNFQCPAAGSPVEDPEVLARTVGHGAARASENDNREPLSQGNPLARSYGRPRRRASRARSVAWSRWSSSWTKRKGASRHSLPPNL